MVGSFREPIAGKANILVVGAGGIGCELLKTLIVSGFTRITILDLDTIDTSNLNRQFLFRRHHVKRSKALVARESALEFNPAADITALHQDITDPRFDIAFFRQFDTVLSALDNLGARRHLNLMCMAADVFLVESGTAGYRGQVQPIKKGETECFDCVEHPTPTTFAVCTIRSTPSTPHHCIVWAKSYLFPLLYGPDNESDEELAQAEANGEDSGQVQELVVEAQENRKLREYITDESASSRVIDKVFVKDIEKLCKMTDMWKTRKPPTPLTPERCEELSTANGTSAASDPQQSKSTLRDMKKLSLPDSLHLLKDSMRRLSLRQGPLFFDKDDEDTLDFVTAATNLRAACFGIQDLTRYQVKEYAGNIIPAIATSNAIVAGVIVLQCLAGLQGLKERRKISYLTRLPNHVLSNLATSPPNPNCPVCTAIYVSFRATPSSTLGDVLSAIDVPSWQDPFFIVRKGTAIIHDEDDLDHSSLTLEGLGIAPGTLLTVSNDNEPMSYDLVLSLEKWDSSIHVPSATVGAIRSSKKRSADELDDDDEPVKKVRTDNADADPSAVLVVDADDALEIE